MNNLSHFDRSKILFNSDFTNILTPSSLYFQKNKTCVDITQEEDKSNLFLHNKNNNLNSYTTKNSKGINLMFDYKNNVNKKKKSNHFYNYTNQQSPNNKNTNFKKTNKFEENKNEIIYNFKKVNPNKTAGRFSETNHISNKTPNNIMTKFYTYNKTIKILNKGTYYIPIEDKHAINENQFKMFTLNYNGCTKEEFHSAASTDEIEGYFSDILFQYKLNKQGIKGKNYEIIDVKRPNVRKITIF